MSLPKEKSLIIVESPVKIKKFTDILPSNFYVISTLGHIMDLAKSHMALDFDNDFAPTYEFYTEAKKKANNAQIKKLAKQCARIYIASDLDREGEFIGESVRQLLKIKSYYRIVFSELTKKAITYAILNPIQIDYNKIHAQQVRRFMDRIFGYSTTPLLPCIPELSGRGELKGLGCGRVQNIVCKLIVDKEKEIADFYNTDRSVFYQGSGLFDVEIDNGDTFSLETNMYKDGKVMHLDKNSKVQEYMVDTLISLSKSDWSINDIKKRIISKKPNDPYITSTLQTDASTKLHWTIKKTMEVAQRLYETGFITYMRTDSTVLSEDALNDIETMVSALYGSDYHERKQYECQQDNAQEAHECIRPTAMTMDIESLSDDCEKLYNLIWKRSMASQMAKAEVESSQLIIMSDTLPSITMVGSKSRYIFKGYTILDEDDHEPDIIIPHDVKHLNTKCNNVYINENVTSPPSRYNESQMVKHITKVGVGRPSTFVSMVEKVQVKDYVRCENVQGRKKILWSFDLDYKAQKLHMYEHVKEVGKELKRLVPTELGFIVTKFLEENFPQIMDVNFTVNMEKQLDQIINGDLDWLQVLHDFYDEMKDQIDTVNEKYGVITDTKAGFLNNVVVGEYEGNEILYFKCKGKFVIKCCHDNKDIWVNVDARPTEEDAILMIEDRVKNTYQPKTSIIKTVGKYTIRKNNESGKYCIQTGKVTKKFYPIFGDIDAEKITGKQCKEIEDKFKKPSTKKTTKKVKKASK